LKLPSNRQEQSRLTLARRRSCVEFSRRQVEMVWRATVHFFQARKTVIPIEAEAAMAGAVKCIRVAAGAAAPDVAGSSMRPQEV
jgi:hypothetical protein